MGIVGYLRWLVMCADKYFPPGSLDPRPGLHAFRVSWYTSHLVSMGEGPLYPPAPDGPPTYRFLDLPSFSEPTVVRLVEADGFWRAVCKRTDGQGGYSPGKLVGNGERELSRAEAKQLSRLLERVGVWEMPSFGEGFGKDGTRCVLEGVQAGRYHVVDRWSPCGTPYAELVEFLLGLSRGLCDPSPEPPTSFRSFAELATSMGVQPEDKGST